jgi:hypothetical protein
MPSRDGTSKWSSAGETAAPAGESNIEKSSRRNQLAGLPGTGWLANREKLETVSNLLAETKVYLEAGLTK